MVYRFVHPFFSSSKHAQVPYSCLLISAVLSSVFIRNLFYCKDDETLRVGMDFCTFSYNVRRDSACHYRRVLPIRPKAYTKQVLTKTLYKR